MSRVHLLTVEQTWHLKEAGLLVVHPDFRVPQGGFPTQREEVAVVETPSGTSFEANAQFNLSHFNIPDPHVSIDRRWRVTVSLLNVPPERLPVGSKLFVSREIAEILFRDANAEPPRSIERP